MGRGYLGYKYIYWDKGLKMRTSTDRGKLLRIGASSYRRNSTTRGRSCGP